MGGLNGKLSSRFGSFVFVLTFGWVFAFYEVFLTTFLRLITAYIGYAFVYRVVGMVLVCASFHHIKPIVLLRKPDPELSHVSWSLAKALFLLMPIDVVSTLSNVIILSLTQRA